MKDKRVNKRLRILRGKIKKLELNARKEQDILHKKLMWEKQKDLMVEYRKLVNGHW